VDASAFAEDTEAEEREVLKKFKKIFINAKIVEEEGEEWKFNEGCLSIPKVREDILRKPSIRIQYYDEKFNFFDEKYTGIAARVIQHEYDHIEGRLFIDRITPFRKRLINGKLINIAKGKVDTDYKMRFATKK
jgi:peptide deformylase